MVSLFLSISENKEGISENRDGFYRKDRVKIYSSLYTSKSKKYFSDTIMFMLI